jgi:hypothetical protein
LFVSSGVGVIMRSAIYGVIFTAFLASAGIVQAGELDGKSLFCTNTSDKIHPVYGLVFGSGHVSKYIVKGYIKTSEYTLSYWLTGTKLVDWNNGRLNRETLKTSHNDQCAISSKTKIFQKLDEIIATAKKKNKI